MQVPSVAPLRILALSGSLRAGSYNTALLRAAQELAPDTLAVTLYDLRALPMYDGDLESQGLPEAVKHFVDALRTSDGLLLATPEYNASFPAVLKNAIDWASRPPQPTALVGLPTALMGAAAGMSGSMRAQMDLRAVLAHTDTPVMLKPEIYVAQPATKLGTDGALNDEPTRALMQRFLTAFEGFVRRTRAPQPALASR